ncbi:hypothetical protein B0H66DRAFT_530126 [Apodospora peruviana]|uniref:Uncharacterized protein n=1 Tax=Apodospora peruviana TaxID=516989 RepID=A0AAE0IKP5_9PEZI|nr:hypothetical protein B0H66DRAFT_530126 [Apodospora peruviana]
MSSSYQELEVLGTRIRNHLDKLWERAHGVAPVSPTPEQRTPEQQGGHGTLGGGLRDIARMLAGNPRGFAQFAALRSRDNSAGSGHGLLACHHSRHSSVSSGRSDTTFGSFDSPRNDGPNDTNNHGNGADEQKEQEDGVDGEQHEQDNQAEHPHMTQFTFPATTPVSHDGCRQPSVEDELETGNNGGPSGTNRHTGDNDSNESAASTHGNNPTVVPAVVPTPTLTQEEIDELHQEHRKFRALLRRIKNKISAWKTERKRLFKKRGDTVENDWIVSQVLRRLLGDNLGKPGLIPPNNQYPDHPDYIPGDPARGMLGGGNPPKSKLSRVVSAADA